MRWKWTSILRGDAIAAPNAVVMPAKAGIQ
jgi:hypothetical protein